jgi:hypothetical protein
MRLNKSAIINTSEYANYLLYSTNSGDEMKVYLHSCLIPERDGSERSDLRPGLFNPGTGARYFVNRRLGVFRSRSEQRMCSAGNKSKLR